MVAETNKASAVFDELREMTAGGLAARRPNGPQWGETASATASIQRQLQELREMEDVAITLTSASARAQVLALLRQLRDDVIDPLVVTDA